MNSVSMSLLKCSMSDELFKSITWRGRALTADPDHAHRVLTARSLMGFSAREHVECEVYDL